LLRLGATTRQNGGAVTLSQCQTEQPRQKPGSRALTLASVSSCQPSSDRRSAHARRQYSSGYLDPPSQPARAKSAPQRQPDRLAISPHTPHREPLLVQRLNLRLVRGIPLSARQLLP
jgi:hypothetical protein